MPFSVVLLAAYVSLHEAIPPDVIVEPGGPIPVSQAFPGFAPEIVKIARPGVEYTWGLVHDWVKSGWDAVTSVFGSVQSLTYDIAATMIDASQALAQEAWSSMINHVQAYAATGLVDLFDLAMTVEGYFLELTNAMLNDIAFLFDVVVGIDAYVEGKIWEAVQGIEGTMQDMLDFGLGAVMGWAIDTILNPLLGDIAAVLGAIDDIVGGLLDGTIAGIETILGELARLLDIETLERVAGIAALSTTIAGILTWLAECGVPMCDLIGPKTDFAKLWNAVKGLLTIIAGVELANLTESDLERIAAAFGAIGIGAASQFAEDFVAGGATLGGAGGGLIGGITDAGREALSVLGIPVA